MKSAPLSLSLFAVLLTALIAPAPASAASNPAALSSANAPILYEHDGALFRVDPAHDVVTRLTAQEAGIYRIEGSWSPQGARVVYTRASNRATWNQDVYLKEKLYTVDAFGGPGALLTQGPDRYQQPAWGSASSIALIDATTRCLSTVRYGGKGLHSLFCPPFAYATEVEWSTPQWSPDDKSIFVQAGQWGTEGLEPSWHDFVYRVDATSGVARLLFKRSFDEPQSLALSPDGTHGIYPEGSNGTRMVVVDFATGKKTGVGLGTGGAYYGIRYSPDGRRVAFSHDAVVINPNGSYRAYIGTYVMRADGSHLRLITSEDQTSADQTIQITESVAGWSGDGSQILLNRTCAHLEHGLYVGYPSIRTVNVATHAVRTLPKVKGTAGDGAWFQH